MITNIQPNLPGLKRNSRSKKVKKLLRRTKRTRKARKQPDLKNRIEGITSLLEKRRSKKMLLRAIRRREKSAQKLPKMSAGKEKNLLETRTKLKRNPRRTTRETNL